MIHGAAHSLLLQFSASTLPACTSLAMTPDVSEPLGYRTCFCAAGSCITGAGVAFTYRISQVSKKSALPSRVPSLKSALLHVLSPGQPLRRSHTRRLVIILCCARHAQATASRRLESLCKPGSIYAKVLTFCWSN